MQRYEMDVLYNSHAQKVTQEVEVAVQDEDVVGYRNTNNIRYIY